MKNRTQELISKLSGKDIKTQMEILSSEFENISFSTSLGFEDQVITDFIFSNNFDFNVFTLDTGRIFEETYKTLNKTINRYKRHIDIYFPERSEIEYLISEKGPFSFYESLDNRKECCNIRKVKPLARALSDVGCWITGLRQEQSDARHDLQIIEWDDKYKLFKYSPLLDWTLADVKNYIKEKNVPYNVLHDKGFVSIGCEPCTRAIKPGESFRSGRWWWENNSKKECGLHE